MPASNLVNRFLSKITIQPNDGCWIWNAGKDKDGYGQFWLNSSGIRAHRMSFILFIGPIPKGGLVCHHCDNPSCVRTLHLFLGSHKENTKDMILKGRSADNSNNLIKAQEGTQNINSRFTEADVREIRRLSNSGLSNYAIGKIFGCPRQTIRQITTRQTWKHVN